MNFRAPLAILNPVIRLSFYIVFSLFLSACAYHLGDTARSVPGGYEEVAIPVFSNRSDEVSIETYFTNSLREEFERSRVAKVIPKDHAAAVLEGEIRKVDYSPTSQVIATAANAGGVGVATILPANTVLNTEYRVSILTHLQLRRSSDKKIIWQQDFNRERVYTGPQIGSDFINSADALYNQSSRLKTISQLAAEMMEEAHDCLTETF